MQFALSQEAGLLRESAQDWLARHRPHHPRAHGEAPACDDAWADFARHGWLGLPFDEALGGSGAGIQEACALAEALGRHLVAQPYPMAVQAGGRLLQSVASPTQRARLVPDLVEGRRRLALAHAEAGDVTPWSARRLQAVRVADGWLLEGGKQAVESAPQADLCLASARCEDGAHRVFAVDLAVPSLHRDAYTALHGGASADLRFNAVRLPADALLGEGAAPHDAALEAAVAEGLVTACWAASGAIARLVELTQTHVRQRRQFGRALVEFQAVEHGLAEMLLDAAQAQAACELAAARLARGDPPADTASAALVPVAGAADRVAKRAVQLHGAMGVCEALPVAAAYRWLEVFQCQHGAAPAHAAWLARRLQARGWHAASAVLGG